MQVSVLRVVISVVVAVLSGSVAFHFATSEPDTAPSKPSIGERGIDGANTSAYVQPPMDDSTFASGDIVKPITAVTEYSTHQEALFKCVETDQQEHRRLTPEECKKRKTAAIDALVRDIGISEVSNRFDSVLQSEFVDEEWALPAEESLRRWYTVAETTAAAGFYFECAETICYADFPLSVIRYREELAPLTRTWLSTQSGGFLGTSYYVGIEDELIRQYFFRDTFDVVKIKY